jgi:deoxyribonuclease-4
MEAELFFGPAGIPHGSKSSSTRVGVEYVAKFGLGCIEIQFVQGVKMGEKAALAVREVATKNGIKLSAHAPYFINLNAHEPEKINASKERLLQAARIAAICGAWSVIFHPAFYLGDSPNEAYETIKKHLEEVVTLLEKENNKVMLRPETMGKHSQFGTLEEILNLSAEVEGVAPCLDFAHWHARTGAANSYQEFVAILDQVEKRLGRQALDNIHIHLSGIAYGRGGETKHLLLEESDLRYKELLRALKERQVKGLLICESPNLEEDALLLQQTYQEIEVG